MDMITQTQEVTNTKYKAETELPEVPVLGEIVVSRKATTWQR
jgi:hypothetical protein